MGRKRSTVKKTLCVLALTGILSGGYAQIDTTSDHYYLYTYNYGMEEDSGPRLAVSTDGINWEMINEEQPIFTPTAGVDKLARDPSMWFDGKTGVFHCVWTSGWNETGIGYATSKDLITWSDPVQLPVGQKIPGCACCWRPEIFYDDLKDSVMIYWSSEFSSAGKRTFYVMTKDFVTFTDPVTLFDPGYSEIDASIIKYAEGKYYLFFKDERTAMEALQVTKNIHYVYGPTPQGPWSEVSSPITGPGSDGPSPIMIGDELRVYFDAYLNTASTKRMLKVTADPLTITTGEWPAGDTLMADGAPFTPGQGSVMEVRREYVMALVYGTPLPPFVSSSASGIKYLSQKLTVVNNSTPRVYNLLGQPIGTFRNNSRTATENRLRQTAPGLLVKSAKKSSAESILNVR